MKKSSILNLIRYHVEKNEPGFRAQASAIANEFEQSGDIQLATYIMSLLSDANVFVPQSADSESEFMKKIDVGNSMLLLPDPILQDVLGVVNAIKRKISVNKFLFQGPPGTGKTEAAKHLARLLGRELYVVDIPSLVDSKLGQTQKNIAALFDEVASFSHPEKVVLLFDEIDSLALDRTSSNDVQEMARACTALFKGMDSLRGDIVLVATTNLFERFDKALVRRFHYVVDFSRYTEKDLVEIAEQMLTKYLREAALSGRDIRLFRKVLKLGNSLPYPGVLQNLIRTAIAFSDPDDENDYLRRLYAAIVGGDVADARKLQEKGLTIREVGILMKRSKSGIGRELNG